PNTTADIQAINPVIKVISISKIRRIIKQINSTIISQMPFLNFLTLLNKLCFIFLHPLQENVYQSAFFYHILPLLVREIISFLFGMNLKTYFTVPHFIVIFTHI